jgi:hypothetical protein
VQRRVAAVVDVGVTDLGRVLAHDSLDEEGIVKCNGSSEPNRDVQPGVVSFGVVGQMGREYIVAKESATRHDELEQKNGFNLPASLEDVGSRRESMDTGVIIEGCRQEGMGVTC